VVYGGVNNAKKEREMKCVLADNHLSLRCARFKMEHNSGRYAVIFTATLDKRENSELGYCLIQCLQLIAHLNRHRIVFPISFGTDSNPGYV
jgi:hypothetical protein